MLKKNLSAVSIYKLSVLLVFCIFVTYNSLGQTENDTAYLKGYYSAINKAELSITTGNLPEAMNLYEQYSCKKLYLSDINNYYTTCIYTKNYKRAIDAVKEMVERGVGKKFFTSSVFNIVRTNADFKKAIQFADKKRVEKLQKYSKLISSLDSLFQKDQELFKYRVKNQLWGDLSDSLAKVNDKNMEILLSTIHQYGFPSAMELPPKNDDSMRLFGLYDYFYVCIHCLQASKNDSLKKECAHLILQAFYSGKIYISDFQLIQKLTNVAGDETTGENLYAYYSIDENIYKDTSFSQNDINRINAFRKNILLPTLEDNEKKLAFIFSLPPKQYHFTSITYSYISSKEIFDSNPSKQSLVKITDN